MALVPCGIRLKSDEVSSRKLGGSWGQDSEDGGYWQAKRQSLSYVRIFVTPWTIQSTEFSRPEYWSG